VVSRDVIVKSVLHHKFAGCQRLQYKGMKTSSGLLKRGPKSCRVYNTSSLGFIRCAILVIGCNILQKEWKTCFVEDTIWVRLQGAQAATDCAFLET
jgi:hypothetical protein